VTPQVFQFIGPSNDGRRHGRGTHLFVSDKESYLYPICMKFDEESDRESGAKTHVRTAPNAAAERESETEEQ
jgi:hypothetical protein